MNTISANIAQLLHEYECVVVPGFGGFVTNYRASEVDTSAKAIRPPMRDLDFIDKLTFNDGVLVRRLAERNGRSYQEAINSIEEYTKNCTKALYNQQPIYVPKVGEIRADAKGNTHFQAENTNFLTDAFGLPELDLKPIHVTTPPTPVKTAITPAPVVTSQTKNMAKSSFNLFNLLLLATLLFAAYYVWDRYGNTKRNTPQTEKKLPVYDDDEDLYNYNDNQTELEETDDIDYTDNMTVISSDDEYIDNETVEEIRTPQEPVETVREEVVKPTKTPTTNTSPTRSYGTQRYVIIVGSFADGGNAKRMINECRRQGYETTTSWSGSMKRVGVVVNCSKNQLNSKLRQVQNRFNSGAWVMK